MVGESGKAMQDTVPRATVMWEVTQNFEESEAHRVCGLFGTHQRCICRAKYPKAVTGITLTAKHRSFIHLE
jgi:hypothetical protein